MADAVTAIRAAAGDRSLKLSYTTMIVTTDAELETARDQMSFRLVDSPADIRDRIGLSPADVESLRAELGAGGPGGAGRLVVDEWVLPFVISGTLAECRAELDRRAARDGLDEFQVTVLDIDQAESLIERGVALVDGEPRLDGAHGP